MSCRRLLVVDDDAKFLHFVTELLIGAGYSVRGTEDAFTAARLAEDFQPDLMILDISMPGKDGLQLAEELRAGEKTSSIPCLFLTGKPSQEGLHPARSVGALGYLEKPVRSLTLLWTIKALLDGKAGIPDAGKPPGPDRPQ